MPPHEKKCPKCELVKVIDDYHRDITKSGGRKSHCKKCVSDYKRRYREENRDKERDYKRRYREENRDKRAEYKRLWYEENLEYARARNRNKMRDYQRSSEAFLDKPKGSRWTPEEDAFLLANDGRTHYQKAIELGRTHKSVRKRLSRLRQAGRVGQDA